MTLLECLRQEALRLGRCGLSSKELSRVEVMGRVKAGSLRLKEAAELLGLSYRQIKRVWARYRGGARKPCSTATAGASRIDPTRKHFARRCSIKCALATQISDPRWRRNTWRKKPDSQWRPRPCGAG